MPKKKPSKSSLVKAMEQNEKLKKSIMDFAEETAENHKKANAQTPQKPDGGVTIPLQNTPWGKYSDSTIYTTNPSWPPTPSWEQYKNSGWDPYEATKLIKELSDKVQEESMTPKGEVFSDIVDSKTVTILNHLKEIYPDFAALMSAMDSFIYGEKDYEQKSNLPNTKRMITELKMAEAIIEELDTILSVVRQRMEQIVEKREKSVDKDEEEDENMD